jgi:cytochrome c553
MNKLLMLSFFAVPFLTVQSCSSTTEYSNENFKQTILQCNNCHSATASTADNVPLLGGMDNQYLIEQLENFRFDKRGADSLSASTQEMSRQVKALQDDELQQIANYYEVLPTVNSTETVVGDINNGKVLYATNCKGCHSSYFGRFFTNSPKISHLKGPYILEQLTLFGANKRHFYTENKHKIKMAEVSKLFNNKELSDITAYIKSKQSAQ